MDSKERIEELHNALGSIYRVRMHTRYEDLGRIGVTEIAVAEMMVHRALSRAKGQPLRDGIPRTLSGIRAEVERMFKR